VSLLPGEVNDRNRARSVRRRLIGGTIAVFFLVIAAVLGAVVLAGLSQAGLATARVTSQELLAREAEFKELRATKQQIALIEAGQIVGASTEIEWKDYLQKLQKTLPPGVIINSVLIDSASPFADYGQSSAPLQGSRVATLSFAAVSPTIPDIPDWLDGLSGLVGFVDAVPDSVIIQEDGSYLVNMTMHINSDAYSLRFPEEGQ
jgi:Tfp pilus assembly protein PilN